MKENEAGAVGMYDGAVFAGGPHAILMTSDYLNWYQWFCPLAEVVGLHASDGLLAVVGDNQLAVSEVRHKGKLWQSVEITGATCVHILRSKAFVGTADGHLFEFAIKRRRGWKERLGLSMTSPEIGMAEERYHVQAVPA